jgi:hypothetical protein
MRVHLAGKMRLIIVSVINQRSRSFFLPKNRKRSQRYWQVRRDHEIRIL